IDATGLQQAHHLKHVETLGRTKNIRRIGHGVDQLGGWRRADYAVLEKANGVGSVGFLGDDKCNQWQTHPDENQFAIFYFAGSGTDHEFGKGVRRRALLGRTAGGGCPYMITVGRGLAARLHMGGARHRFIADLRGSAMVSKGSRAPSLGTIHFFSLAMISRSNFLSSALGRKSGSC